MNFLVDAAILVLLCAVLWVSGVVHFVFPAASDASGWRLWGLDYEQWQFLQVVALSGFSLGVLLHLILNWSWVCGFVTTRLSRLLGRRIHWNEAIKTAYGVSSLIVALLVMGSLLLAAELQIRAPNRDEPASGAQKGISVIQE